MNATLFVATTCLYFFGRDPQPPPLSLQGSLGVVILEANKSWLEDLTNVCIYIYMVPALWSKVIHTPYVKLLLLL